MLTEWTVSYFRHRPGRVEDVTTAALPAQLRNPGRGSIPWRIVRGRCATLRTPSHRRNCRKTHAVSMGSCRPRFRKAQQVGAPRELATRIESGRWRWRGDASRPHFENRRIASSGPGGIAALVEHHRKNRPIESREITSPINAACSTGRCNTSQSVDPPVLPRKRRSV